MGRVEFWFRRALRPQVSGQPLAIAAVVAFVSFTNCYPDFDRLTSGNGVTAGGGAAPAVGGTGGASGSAPLGGKSGGSGTGGSVVTSGAGGSLSDGGDAGGGGASGAGGNLSDGGDAGDGGSSGGSATTGGGGNSGGSATTGGGGNSGGSATTGGGGNSGGSTTTGGAGGSGGQGGMRVLDSVCPSDTGASGVLLSPPSTNFEEAGSWTTLGGHSCTRMVASASTGNACSGSAFLTCDVRQAPWDGPTIVVPSFVYGHTYAITVALRYSPASAPTTASPLAVTCIRTCAGGTPQYAIIGSTMSSTSEWVRISGEVTASLAGCSQLSDFRFYLNTLHEQQTYEPVDMDDFRIYDLTPGAGGNGGAGG